MPDIFEAEDLEKKKTDTSSPTGTPLVPPSHTSQTIPPSTPPPSSNEPPVTPSTSPTEHSENHFHALASYCQNPNNIHFNTQEPDEIILLFLRAHFATNLSWILMTIFFAFLPIVLAIAIPQVSPENIFDFIPSAYITVLFSFYYLILFAYAFINFITWLYNIFLVTTMRIVDIDFSNIVFHQVAATKKDLIQDVRYDQVGFVPSLLDFGSLFISTASDVPIFEAINIPHPRKAVHFIQKLIGKTE